MENSPNKDEEIRDAIIAVLHKAYRNPKGKYQHVTFSVLHREVSDIVACEREDVQRELHFLEENSAVDKRKLTHRAYALGTAKIPASITEYYVLSGKTLNNLEQKSRYSKDNWTQKSTNIINIKDSTINAPVTAGQQIVVSYNPRFDLENIISLVKEKLSEEDSKETIEILKEHIPELLENPNAKSFETLLEKLKNIGQHWLVPIITQLAATYFAHKLGINN